MKSNQRYLPIGLALAVMAVVACGEVVVPAQAADEATQHGVALGQKGPDWNGLEGVDGKSHSLDDYADAKLVVVVFTCNHCPVAQAYQDRIIDLTEHYQGKGVQFVAINVNNMEQDKLPAMKERAAEKALTSRICMIRRSRSAGRMVRPSRPTCLCSTRTARLPTWARSTTARTRAT